MPTNAELYDQDFAAWCWTTAALLRAGQWNALDPASVAEEIEGLAKSDRRALGSHLRNLLLHLLKWRYQPEGRQPGASWRQSIRNARAEMAVLLEDSPSLRQAVPSLMTRWYALARQDAADETRLPLATFPAQCPWTMAQILDEAFWPDDEPAASRSTHF